MQLRSSGPACWPDWHPRRSTWRASVPPLRQLRPPVALGFIGLGNMGARMAARLLEAGHPLVVAAEVFAAPGGVRSPAADRLLHHRPRHRPRSGRLGAGRAAPRGRRLAHPLPGASHDGRARVRRCGGAAAGTLTFMCGGKQEAIAAAEPVLAVMGKRVVHCGPSGNGQAAKLCNNLVLAIQMAGISEGLAMGRRLGLDPKLLSDIFNSSTAACWSSHTNNPCPAGPLPSRNPANGPLFGLKTARARWATALRARVRAEYEGGFGSSLMLKDLGLAMAAAEQCASPVPVGSLVEQLYRVVVEEGGGRQDFSSIFRHIYREGHAGPKPCKHPHPDEGERRDG
eukprot:jgi/Tetstr1/461550/TSEL_006656.t1